MAILKLNTSLYLICHIILLFGSYTALSDWRGNVYLKLATTFKEDGETLSRIMFYLTEEEKTYADQTNISPVWRTLKDSLDFDSMFRNYAIRLAEDTKNAEKDPEFRKTMSWMYEQMLKASDVEGDLTVHQGFNLEKFIEKAPLQKSGLLGFVRGWSQIPISTQSTILKFIGNYVPQKVLVGSGAYELVGFMNKASSDLVMVKLAFVSLSYETIVNIHRWWKGEISGKRCLKNILDSIVTTFAGVGGGIGGAAMGGCIAGPFGAFVGGLGGALISSQAANYLSDRLTQWFFAIPKEQALENAYNFFGIKMDASNHEINSVYRKHCLKYHPDRGGSNEDFHFVQVNMAIIKAAKGEY